MSARLLGGMTRIRYGLLFILALSSTASAVVIRHDVADTDYRIPESHFPALADLPCEGHGVLIAAQWVVTAAHAVSSPHMQESPQMHEVTINGVPRRIERIFMHPGYRKLPEALVEEALASGDGFRITEFLSVADDIALIRLAAPVSDVAPVALYRGDDEVGKIVEIVGKGATGNGMHGQPQQAPHRTALRRAFNTIIEADARWISHVFDTPDTGLALEGIGGNGDSGGPLLINGNGGVELVGLGSFNKYAQSEVRAFHAGLYGQTGYSVRVSRYIAWIESVLSAPVEEG